MLQRIKNFAAALAGDYCLLLFWLVLFSLFRGFFIGAFAEQLDSSSGSVLEAMRLGLKLSLKTAGAITLLGGAFASLPLLLWPRWPAAKIRFVWHSLMLVVFTLFFCGRLPYYAIFHSGYNRMLLNVFHDDTKAIFLTAVAEYQLWWRLPVALVLCAVLCLALRFVCRRMQELIAAIELPAAAGALLIGLLPVVFVFCRFGGAFNYAHSLNYFNADRFPSTLLNEAVLDDGQALYRVYSIHKLQRKAQQLDISPTELRQRIAALGGKADAPDIESAFLRKVDKPLLATQPRTVFFILGENNAQWPFLPDYYSLQLVPEQQRLLASGHALAVETMLSHSGGTIFTVNGLLTGLPDAGVYSNLQPETYKTKYATGIGPIMQQLGYKTVFWYGGFAQWQSLKDFALAQGFDEFHCADELTYAGGNAWGCPDLALLAAVQQYDAVHPQEKSFHFILTTSNHPPYDVDLKAAGIDTADLQGHLPEKIADTPQNLRELGHIRYMDKAIGQLIKATDRPDSLFIITGDHAERFTFAAEPTAVEQSAVPCIIYSAALPQLPTPARGCQQQLPATLATLCAPAGFGYSSLLPPLWQADSPVFNHALVLDPQRGIIPESSAAAATRQKVAWQRSIGLWRMLKGNALP